MACKYTNQAAAKNGNEPMLNPIKQTPITLSIAAAAIIAFMIPSLIGAMQLDTTSSLISQIPQLFSCHLLHWSLDHLGWDLFMFVLVGMICERRNQTGFALVLLLSAILIPVFVVSFAPTLGSYRGLSGLDTGLFAFAAIMLIVEAFQDENWQSVVIYAALFVGMLGKIGYELAYGGTLFVDSTSFSPVPVAHIVGAVVGTIVALNESVRYASSALETCSTQM